MKNLEQFKALIERYETITLEEIQNVFRNIEYSYSWAKELTGFGSMQTCTLCLATKDVSALPVDCKSCVWYFTNERHYNCYCTEQYNYETYIAIGEASNPSELLQAYRNRAEYMREIIARLGL